MPTLKYLFPRSSSQLALTLVSILSLFTSMGLYLYPFCVCCCRSCIANSRHVLYLLAHLWHLHIFIPTMVKAKREERCQAWFKMLLLSVHRFLLLCLTTTRQSSAVVVVYLIQESLRHGDLQGLSMQKEKKCLGYGKDMTNEKYNSVSHRICSCINSGVER